MISIQLHSKTVETKDTKAQAVGFLMQTQEHLASASSSSCQ